MRFSFHLKYNKRKWKYSLNLFKVSYSDKVSQKFLNSNKVLINFGTTSKASLLTTRLCFALTNQSKRVFSEQVLLGCHQMD